LIIKKQQEKGERKKSTPVCLEREGTREGGQTRTSKIKTGPGPVKSIYYPQGSVTTLTGPKWKKNIQEYGTGHRSRGMEVKQR